MCHNRLEQQGEVDRCMVHELVHAFDHCRAKVDWHNCEHHACSEVCHIDIMIKLVECCNHNHG